jgi:hypothetical protein
MEEQAELTVRRALSLWETQLFYSDHYPYIARSLLSLAVILHHEGKHEQADALYQRVLSVQKRLLGTMHPENPKNQERLYVVSAKHGA